MKCDNAIQLIYLYDVLPEEERVALDSHLQGCTSCAHLYQKALQERGWVKSASTTTHQPVNEANLTHRIMSSIEPAPRFKALTYFIEFLNTSAAQYSLSALSIVLVLFFMSEYARVQDTRTGRNIQPERREQNVHPTITRRFPPDSKRNPTRTVNAWLMASLTIDAEQFKFATRYLSDQKNPVQASYHQMYQCLLQCHDTTGNTCNQCKKQWIKLNKKI